MDIEIDTYSVKIIENNLDNIKNISNKILDNNLVIFPTDSVFELGCFGLDENAINNLYNTKQKSLNDSIKLNCLGFYDVIPLVHISEKELKLFKLIVDKFWPGPLSILLKSNNEILPNKLINKDGYTCFQSPKHPIIRKLIQYSSSPIASSGANISNKIRSTCLDHVLDCFGDKNIYIFDDKYKSKYGYDTTLIQIDNNNINILRHGPISIDKLENFINLNISDIKYNYLLLNNYIKYNKNIFTFNIIDIDIKINQNIIDNYFDKTFLIDFNKLCNKYKNKFIGYVDLSEIGDINEALFNLYNVLHQIQNIDFCNQVYIFDFSFIELQSSFKNILWNKCLNLSSNKQVSVPLKFMI